ncbi:MAG: hypothetical protein CMI12_01970 [Oceanospirillum sp.]|nr:hypothetical protein [Oceanospirillum sp.]
MVSVFKRAASKRLKHKKNVQQQPTEVLSDVESQVLLHEVQELIAEVESAAEGQKEDVTQRLKQVHEQHKAILAKQRITGPLG